MLIKPQALANLAMSQLTIKAGQPFPSLPFSFLTLSATVNDNAGGYVRFTIQSMADAQSQVTQNVPSGIIRWVPNLSAGTYQINAMPCNSLGCRTDLTESNLYQQQANVYPALQDVQTTFNECFGLLQQLYDSGTTVIKQAQAIEQDLTNKAGLQLAGGAVSTDACVQAAVRDGINSMANLQNLGAPYVGEINANPDALQPIYENFTSQAQSSTATDTKTSTGSTSSTAAVAAKWTFFSLGIASIVGGMMAVAISSAKLAGWVNLEGGRTFILQSIVNQFPTGSSKSQDLAVVNSLEISEVNKAALINTIKQDTALDANPSAGSSTKLAQVKDQIQTIDEPLVKAQSSIKTANIGLTAGLVLLGGGLATTVTANFALANDQTPSKTTDTGVGTETGTSVASNTTNPLDNAAAYVSNTLIPLQNQFRQCTLTLEQKISAASSN